DEDHDRLPHRRDAQERSEHEHRVDARAGGERGEADDAPDEERHERDELQEREAALEILRGEHRAVGGNARHPAPRGRCAVRPRKAPPTTATSSTAPNATWT